jgi:hypothetical protein
MNQKISGPLYLGQSQGLVRIKWIKHQNNEEQRHDPWKSLPPYQKQQPFCGGWEAGIDLVMETTTTLQGLKRGEKWKLLKSKQKLYRKAKTHNISSAAGRRRKAKSAGRRDQLASMWNMLSEYERILIKLTYLNKYAECSRYA